MKNKKRGQVWVSAVLYFLIAAITVIIVLNAGIPIIEGMKDKSTYTKTKDLMENIDSQIESVASEGIGSQKIVPIELIDGELKIVDNTLSWKFQTDQKIIEPRTKIQQGNLIISANADVTSQEIGRYYYLKNSLIEVNISKFCNETRWCPIDTKKLLNWIKHDNDTLTGNFSFMVNRDENTTFGTGYTKISEIGKNLGKASVITHVNSSNVEYDLVLTLESYADFITVNIENFKG